MLVMTSLYLPYQCLHWRDFNQNLNR